MNVVVTGATSFLGKKLVDRLLEKDYKVFAVVRPGSENMGNLKQIRKGLVLVEKELGEFHELAEVINVPCQAFYHLGWDGSGSENRTKKEIQQKNVEDSLKALDAARVLGCKRFLFTGSQAEYGIHKDKITEESPCVPVSEYGKAKLEFFKRASEQIKIWRQGGITDMEYVHGRIFSIYGPGDHPWSLVESCIKTFSAGEYISLGECTQMWNYLYADDCISALMLLMETESLSGIYNIGGPESENRPLKEYVREMYELLGFHGSYSYGRRKPNAEGVANLMPSVRNLMEATGWKPLVTFSEGINRIQKYNESNGADRLEV